MRRDYFLDWLEQEIKRKPVLRSIKDKYLELNYPREINIIKFVRNNPGCSKNSVMLHIRKTDNSREMTTWKIINDMISAGVLTMKSSESRWQTAQHLYLGDSFWIK